MSESKTIMVVGRIVWTIGDLFKGQNKTDYNTKAPIIDQVTGQPKKEYGFGLAVSKTSAGALWAMMQEEAFTLFPNRVIPPGFAMKFKDGDGIDDKGLPFSAREGYAGCIVLACKTTLTIKYFKFEGGVHHAINEGIKCGDYVNVQLGIAAHGAKGQGKAGLYINPYAVQFLGYGKEIINAPSGEAIFGNTMPPLPPGASAMPTAPSVPQQMMYPGTQQQQAPVQPHYGVLPPQFQQQAPAMPQYQQQAPAMPQYQQQAPAMPQFPTMPKDTIPF